MKYQNAARTSKNKSKLQGGDCSEFRSFAPIGYEAQVEPPLILYIYDEIGPEVEYVEFCHALRYAPEGQQITIHINSPGGSLNSCLSIINAIRASEADIVTVVDGEAASAAAMIWLAGHTKIIASRHTVVMLHGASVGYTPSKMSDIANSARAITKITETLLDDLTEGFLTKEERDDIRKGVDVFLTGTEIIERLPKEVEEE
jgi:ATP-dependent Clp protease protease subunit